MDKRKRNEAEEPEWRRMNRYIMDVKSHFGWVYDYCHHHHRALEIMVEENVLRGERKEGED